MYKRILVPIDGSDTARCGLREAIRLAASSGAHLRVVHALDALVFATGFETGACYVKDLLPLMREAGNGLLADARALVEEAGLTCETHLFESQSQRLCDQIVSDAKGWGADLIVIGTHGRRGIGRALLGSDAELILRHAPVPVLLVRHPELPGHPELADDHERAAPTSQFGGLMP